MYSSNGTFITNMQQYCFELDDYDMLVPKQNKLDTTE